MTFAAEDVRAVVGTRARQASIRTPDPGPSTATDHLGTAQACHQGEAGERSLEAAGTVGGRPGMSGVTSGAGASEVALRTSKGKGDRVGVRSTEGLTETPGVSIQLAEHEEEHRRPCGPGSGLRLPWQEPFS